MTHLVTDEAMTIGRRFGRYATCCGVEIVAASLTAPEAGRCKRCRAWRAGAVTAREPQRPVVGGSGPTTQAGRSVGGMAPAESDLAVLALQVSWALADAAHDLPAGRLSAQCREELADTLQALGFVLRVTSPGGGW